MKILYIGEIVGKAGVFAVKNILPELKEKEGIDFVIANGEGTTGGFGIGKNHSIYLHKLGIDVITGGEKLYFKKDIVGQVAKASYMLRPANYPPSAPGRGWRIFQVKNQKIGVISLLGLSGFPRVHPSNPFSFAPELIRKIKEETPHIILDFHASTTAEKQTMFHHLDGQLSAILGSHSKALTADDRVMPRGTAVICDTGRTGSQLSVAGLESSVEVGKFLTAIPERSQDAWDQIELQGALVELNDDGTAKSIKRLRIPCTEAPLHERQS